jgi:transcription antitermination factor NusG
VSNRKHCSLEQRVNSQMDSVSSLQWYVVAVRPNSERSATLHLRDKGYETLLPLYRVRRKWSDRSKEIETPLFTGYAFCRFDARQRLPILQVPGVVSILGFPGTGPIPVDDGEIDAIRTLVRSGLLVGPWPLLREGHFVTVERGPLAGVSGIVIEAKSKCRLVISVSLLQRSVYAEVERDWVVPQESAQPALTASVQFSPA